MRLIMSYDIQNIEQLIATLGGPTVLSQELGISQEAVSMWKSREHIGTGWHLRLLAMARRQGLSVNPEVFGLSEHEAKGLFGPLMSRALSAPA